MLLTVVLGLAAGVMGANAFPHFAKGMMGEEFPNVTGNAPLRNAIAGTLGFVMAALLGYGADLASHPWAGFAALSAGALVMAVFHGLRGAFWLNRVLGKPNPAPAIALR
ncbi:hypothetical protein [Nocardia jinanensis]|uniref:Uncharacterized protein n=1 Tax=Nocardia jinanensis TaxID=382504 RepID=A0A917RGT6_9NOCA|nr:hypothetical protein [Nocardia jinanensis]GGL07150.1 hypothetical protein GCM10011588_22040 [Nocardia jinanensis]